MEPQYLQAPSPALVSGIIKKPGNARTLPVIEYRVVQASSAFTTLDTCFKPASDLQALVQVEPGVQVERDLSFTITPTSLSIPTTSTTCKSTARISSQRTSLDSLHTPAQQSCQSEDPSVVCGSHGFPGPQQQVGNECSSFTSAGQPAAFQYKCRRVWINDIPLKWRRLRIRTPRGDPGIDPAELQYIVAGGFWESRRKRHAAGNADTGTQGLSQFMQAQLKLLHREAEEVMQLLRCSHVPPNSASAGGSRGPNKGLGEALAALSLGVLNFLCCCMGGCATSADEFDEEGQRASYQVPHRMNLHHKQPLLQPLIGRASSSTPASSSHRFQQAASASTHNRPAVPMIRSAQQPPLSNVIQRASLCGDIAGDDGEDGDDDDDDASEMMDLERHDTGIHRLAERELFRRMSSKSRDAAAAYNVLLWGRGDPLRSPLLARPELQDAVRV